MGGTLSNAGHQQEGSWSGYVPTFEPWQAPIDWPLQNWSSHSSGYSSSGPVYSKRFGYVPSYMRTSRYTYARSTDGRTYKRTYSAEYPYRQVLKSVPAKQVVTSPGTNPNKAKTTGMDALVIQALKKQGILPAGY
jgi:hypothetical protein